MYKTSESRGKLAGGRLPALVSGLFGVGLSLTFSGWCLAVANPQSGSVGLTGTVQAPPPSIAATIVGPSAGKTVSTIPISVAGTCQTGDFVSVTDNGLFAGAVPCGSTGLYTLLVDLFAGQNQLVAQITDALGQTGPASAILDEYYNAPVFTGAGTGSAAQQLFLQASNTIVGGEPNSPIGRSVTIVGGVAPYAVDWEWGDGQSTLMSESDSGPVAATHSYSRPGTYTVIVKVSDSDGNSAYMQFVTVVNGPAAALGSTNGQGMGAVPGQLVSAWPLFVAAAFAVGIFWLGERVEKRKLRRQNQAL